MKLHALLLLLCLMLFQDVKAQSLLWERTYNRLNVDVLNDVVSLQDGTYLACGFRSEYRQDTLPGSLQNVGLLRLQDNGDTIYVKNLPMYLWPYSSRLSQFSNGKVYVAGTGRDISLADQLQLGQINPTTGDLVNLWNLQGFARAYISVKRVIEGPNHSVILCGYGPDSGSTGTVGYLARYDSVGSLVWTKVIREHPTYTLCNWVEMTSTGILLVSGTAGSRIWAAELSTDIGREIRTSTFYQTPSLTFFNEWSVVRQSPSGLYVVSGSTQGFRTYLGLYQGWAGTPLWGGERRGSTRLAQVNLDSGLVFFEAMSSSYTIKRLKADSSRMWQLAFIQQPLQESTFLNSFTTSGDNNGIAVGSVSFSTRQFEDWYIARISNMGIPYNPAQPVATHPAEIVVPYPYPTPCRQTLAFSGLTAPATLHLQDAQGHRYLTQPLSPNHSVDLSALSPGLYHYRLTAPGHTHSGRIIKE